jgi:ergothioneine biosynthesis protein EgtB
LTAYESTRDTTLEICTPLELEDHTVQPWPFVSPPKWHLGHTTWFFENFLLEPFFKMDPFDRGFKYIFNSYYESQGARIEQARRGILSRPTLDKVLEYRRHIDRRMREALSTLDRLDEPMRCDFLANLELGLHHEQQHQELLMMDIKAILWHQPGRPAYSFSQAFNENHCSKTNWIPIKEGLYEIGAEDPVFAYDIERPRHKVYLENFEIKDGLVSNRDYLAFIEAGGYSQPRYWLSDGWEWIQRTGASHPLYWRQSENHWFEYGLGGEFELNLNAPVSHVNYYEAAAFAHWSGCRLPTEAEWEVAFCNEARQQLWQWTTSAYHPYPNYLPFNRGFEEYNGKFMVNQIVLRGGCSCTPKNHYRPTYRNFFQPERRWQFSGIRLARSHPGHTTIS